ncbi:MAG: type IV pilus twitching motility protein PilT [Candidatus Eisenbacteria bacterium]|uniref:Type IV pilus twitching motility protein PilT n=1 Tax=Eiseniibacteriota bacterium TaxID=2212470 RepID=A0A956NEB1_UNCEI|nr:type IV pilus twitching motility protein PilT [Candidatus Eisenbacteria bacterium]MCB9462718.1 type IV pilus twitching motility protein PilT [Candidatus Eisenbacteria bacterium]
MFGSGGPNVSSGTPELETWLCKLVEHGCSDLHLCAGYPPLFRKDGDITDFGGTADLDSAATERLLRGITPDETWEEFLETNDVDFSYEILGVARYRCNLFRDRQGMGGVFRTIPSVIPTAEQLGLSKPVLGLCDLHKGLVVVTGPTGSGKSTTLAAMIDHINRNQARHIITIEDPIEFVHPKRRALVNQREVGNHTKGFRSALRAALREDPDIVLLGEMRDLETVEIALETAETGHLVFGTLHTNTAASTVDRIIDQFSPDQQAQIRVLLSETLKGVIAQTLCKKNGGGRVAAQEILFVTPAISNLIREGKTFQIPSLMQTGKGQGMQTLDARLLQLVQDGTVTSDEAYSKSLTKNEFKAALERAGHKLPAAA